MNISNALLAQFRGNKFEFMRRLTTVDETWIHHYTPEKNTVQTMDCKGESNQS